LWTGSDGTHHNLPIYSWCIARLDSINFAITVSPRALIEAWLRRGTGLRQDRYSQNGVEEWHLPGTAMGRQPSPVPAAGADPADTIIWSRAHEHGGYVGWPSKVGETGFIQTVSDAEFATGLANSVAAGWFEFLIKHRR